MNRALNALRDEICRVGASLFARGYVHATAGNISVRVPQHAGGGYLITPTDACLGFMAPSDLAWSNSFLCFSKSALASLKRFCQRSTAGRQTLAMAALLLLLTK